MLFSEIVKRETKDNVDQLLSKFHTIRRLAGKPIEQKLTATYTIEPKSFTGVNSNPTEDAILAQTDAQVLYNDIIKAYNCLGPTSRKRLYNKYMSSNPKFDYEVYDGGEESISKATFYRDLEKAQIEFAEAYKNGELMKFKMRQS
ncbi:ArpU family phage packaging/lysis transcriptional regulator [Aerococcaceae bacterium 50-4]